MGKQNFNLKDFDKKIKNITQKEAPLMQKHEELFKYFDELLIEKDQLLGNIFDNLFYSLILFVFSIFFLFLKTWWGIIISIILYFIVFYFLLKAKKFKKPYLEYKLMCRATESLLIEIYKENLKTQYFRE